MLWKLQLTNFRKGNRDTSKVQDQSSTSIIPLEKESQHGIQSGGLIAEQDFTEKAFVGQFAHEPISSGAVRNFEDASILQLNSHTYINISGDPYGTIRPSINPNCYFERYIINEQGCGEVRVRIFSESSIRAGEELTFSNFTSLPFRCTDCSHVYKSTKYDMEEHYNATHGKRFYTCPWCGESLIHSLDLASHRKKHKHSHLSPIAKHYTHRCVICTYNGWKSVFSSRGNLKRHMQSHYPEAHYICAFGCGYRDTRSDTVLSHHRGHQGHVDITARPIRITNWYFPRNCFFCASGHFYKTWYEWWLHIERHCRI